MPNRRIPMRKVREVIRLVTEAGLSHHKTSKATGVSRPTIHDYMEKFRQSGLSLAEINSMPDSSLLKLFKSDHISNESDEKQALLYEQFPTFIKELARTGVNRRVLWEEYREKNPDGYRYSQFCFHLRTWTKAEKLSMHQNYKAGDKMFIDFAGAKLRTIDRQTGKEKLVEVFIAVLGASQYTYVEATGNQKKDNLIRATQNALQYFGGVPLAIIPDCLKSAVNKGSKYEAEINRAFLDLAEYYNTCVLPARPYEPRDKAHVENAVKIVYSNIYAPLRNQAFYTIEELNTAIQELLVLYNSRKMQDRPLSRIEFFKEIEEKALQPLPADLYPMKSFARVTVQINYHVLLKEDEHYYSVPYRHAHQKVELVYTDRVVEIFFDNIRIASHPRNREKYGYTTTHEHRPPNHQFINDWSPERLIRWGASIGLNVEVMVKKILESRTYPEQAFKSCLGVLSLEKKYQGRLDKACARALFYRDYHYRGVLRILERGLESFDEEPGLFPPTVEHENIRGMEYYAMEANHD
jgi:transposase